MKTKDKRSLKIFKSVMDAAPPNPILILFRAPSECSSVGRASPCQGDCHEFESHRPLQFR